MKAAVYRHAWVQRHGSAKTLGEMVRQEGMAGNFAGVRPEPLPEEAASIVTTHLETSHYPTIIACLYGDDAAEACGYEPLGLPAHAGLRYSPVIFQTR